jgi:ABC-type transporter Mla subunit MlaD
MPKLGAAGGFGGRGGGMGRRGGGAGEEEREYRGRDVLPGKYKVVVTANNKKDSAWIEVKDDPRTTSRIDVVKKQDELSKKFQPSVDKLNTALDQLDEVDALLLELTAEWKDKKDKGLDTLNKAHKKVTESAKKLREYVNGKKQDKQGYGTVDVITPMSIIRNATMLIAGKNTVPGEQEEQKLKEAEAAIQDVVAKANDFFTKEWASFRKLVEATPIKKFKDYEVIK